MSRAELPQGPLTDFLAIKRALESIAAKAVAAGCVTVTAGSKVAQFVVEDKPQPELSELRVLLEQIDAALATPQGYTAAVNARIDGEAVAQVNVKLGS